MSRCRKAAAPPVAVALAASAALVLPLACGCAVAARLAPARPDAARPAPAAPGRPATICVGEDARHPVLYREVVAWPDDPAPAARTAYGAVVVGDVSAGRAGAVEAVTVDFVRAPDCGLAYRLSIPGYDAALVRPAALGDLPVVVVTAESHAGAAAHVQHFLLGASLNGLHPIDAPLLDHSTAGGFYIGDLGPGRGPGLAVWDVDNEDEAHAGALRPYVFSFYRWLNGAFTAPERVTTAARYPTRPDAAPTALGFAFRDQSDLAAMPAVLP